VKGDDRTIAGSSGIPVQGEASSIPRVKQEKNRKINYPALHRREGGKERGTLFGRVLSFASPRKQKSSPPQGRNHITSPFL